jgi:membrane protease YdiL (CAAX protease family)
VVRAGRDSKHGFLAAGRDGTMENDNFGRRQLLLLAILFEGGLAVLALLLGWLLELPTWGAIHWSAEDAALGAAASLPMLAGFVLCLYLPLAPLRRIRQVSIEFIKPLFQHCTLLDLALVSTLAGFGEELFFRAFLQAGLGDWLGVWVGLVAASVVFGLLHAITPTYALLASVVGAYLGWLWLASDNLLLPVLAHALYDFIALVYLMRWLEAKPAAVAGAGFSR